MVIFSITEQNYSSNLSKSLALNSNFTTTAINDLWICHTGYACQSIEDNSNHGDECPALVEELGLKGKLF